VTTIAVMVDLGWPWWVTTAIAIGVVAAAAVVFVLRREPAVRAVAAVLAIQGVAIAVIAPFVMEENGGATASTMTAGRATMMGGTPLSHAEFVRRADINCAALNRFIGSLGKWPETNSLPATARFLDRLSPSMRDALRNQAALRAPPAEQATASAWMHSMSALGHAMETVRYSAKARDLEGVRAGYRAWDSTAARSTVLSKRLGLKVCFS
jgi:hypothetical protein